ncbi:MAG: hypothetical protein A2X32_01670 [Elusimicrobia bacterium GWC2_64_44]|nr:MAG: hypothetical protein A2X32_01670 [Elusimicrobia bacterium GWC2_64_44]
MEEGQESLSDKLWLWAGAVIALGALAMPVLNPDLWWHLSAGKYILHNLRLPAADFLSWTEAGAPWTDFEWLAQIIYYGVYALGGKAGFFLLKMLLLGATLPVFHSILKLNGLRGAAFFALPVWGLALMANADLRPENFSVLFFALLLLKLETARLKGGWRASPGNLAGAAAFFALWANLHAGFPYGLLLLAAYCAGNFLERRAWPAAAEPPGLVSPVFLAAALAGTLLNPWGYKLYAILLAHAADAGALSRYLAEWAPPSLANPWHWPFMAFVLSSFGLLLLRFLRERRLPPAHFFVLAVLAFEAGRHTRHIVFFCMAAAVFAFDAAARLWEPERLLRRGRVLLGLAVVYLAVLVWPRYAAFKVNLGEEAAGAAAYLKVNAAQLGGRKIYNPWTWGGYLGWALNPDYKVFTDGRYLFHKYLVPVSAAMESQETWEQFAAQNGFELALFRRDYAMLPFERRAGKSSLTILRPSYLLFMPEEKWALVYWDAFSVLFARRGSPLPRELKIVRAGDLESVKLDLCAGALTPKAAADELALYYKAAAGARSTGEADAFRGWLGGFPAACRR